MAILRHGDRGPEVAELQELLIQVGAEINADGIFGDRTERAVVTFQRSAGLVTDGLAGPKTMRALPGGNEDPSGMPPQLSQADLEDAAERLGVDLAAVMAVNEVESHGEGFLSSGDCRGAPVILFERHIMWRQLKRQGTDPIPHRDVRPDIVNPDPGGYKGGCAEHRRLGDAARISRTAAIESASWGLFQIMGFHWGRLGYANADEFALSMISDEGSQLDAFTRFIETDEALHRSLRRHEWRNFARRYNGPEFEKNDYDTRLASAYRRHGKALAER